MYGESGGPRYKKELVVDEKVGKGHSACVSYDKEIPCNKVVSFDTKAV
jgi:hypothetical protein